MVSYTTIYEFDFVFSFAGEDRNIVESIKKKLVKQNYSVFYDNDFQHVLIGKDLYSYLRNIYMSKGKYVVCFISANYTKKIWTNLEFTAIKERLMSTFFSSDFLIPIIIGESKILEDIPSFFGFYKHESIEKTTKLLINKFETSLIEDNYLKNIENFIRYLCEQVSVLLIKRGYRTETEKNTLIISNQYLKFKFTADKNMNIPCILVYFMEQWVPLIFISWNNVSILRFNIHYFDKIRPSLANQSLNDVIKLLEEYIIEYIA